MAILRLDEYGDQVWETEDTGFFVREDDEEGEKTGELIGAIMTSIIAFLPTEFNCNTKDFKAELTKRNITTITEEDFRAYKVLHKSVNECLLYVLSTTEDEGANNRYDQSLKLLRKYFLGKVKAYVGSMGTQTYKHIVDAARGKKAFILRLK